MKIEIVFKKRDVDHKLFEMATVNIQKLFGEDMQVEFQVLPKIVDDKQKMRKIISKISVPW